MKFVKCLAFVASLAFLGLACSEKVIDPQPIDCDLACQIAKSPFPNAEAENVARYLDGWLVASEITYKKCSMALTQWRRQYTPTDTAWCVDISEGGGNHYYLNPTSVKFFDPGTPGRFEWYFSADSFNLGFPNDTVLTAGQTTNNPVWDSLNSLYRLDSLRIKHYPKMKIVFIRNYFHGRLDSKMLCQAYDVLSGVETCIYQPAIIGGISNLYPGLDSNGLKILVIIGWGDCPSGCMYNAYVYFKQKSDGTFDFLGKWISSSSLPKPPWWSEAFALREAWSNY
ncbi:MAG: hypothetical protein WCT08_03570 [Patescibacteria group bacterium]|jgi:hypothetical protein